ncbi:MAG TPA: class I SAM-dependent methyltransferase [Solirubrobacteraceae bacterium]|nr:class I SAM-dependent methyltransferase [Solirubrobacteraceae bacterium]
MARDPMAPTGVTYYARAIAAAAASPRDAADKLLERRALRRELRVRAERPSSEPDPRWERRLHELLGAPWPCPDAEHFAATWKAANETMAAQGLSVGRANYGDDDDADPGLARAYWCLVHHLRPRAVVETGVAHGLSSRIILEALARGADEHPGDEHSGGEHSSGAHSGGGHAGDGRLFSIDLPAMTILERRPEIGAAITPELHDRWEYLEGSSRRRLAPLLARLGEIDLFIHDSLHSTRNVRWELERAWPALRPGGFVVVDDVDFNWGYRDFLASREDYSSLYCMSDDGQRVFALARKNSK